MGLSMSRTAEYDADGVAAELCGSQAMISALEKIQRRSNACYASDTTEPLASFRAGAFAHSYISSGDTSEEFKEKDGFKGWWARVKTAFSTHPTTESRIEALKDKFVLPPGE